MTNHLGPTGRFLAFHGANPRVLALLIMLTREYIRETGHTKVGFSLIYGAARWKWAIETRDESSAQKLNNDYAPFYARLIMGTEQDLKSIYDLRRSVADDWAVVEGYPAALGFWSEEIAAVSAA